MKHSPKVAFHCSSIFDIDPKFLKENARYLIVDLDNTLDPADVKHPSSRAKSLLNELTSLGLSVHVLSNNTEKRCSEYCEGLPVRYLASAFKYSAFFIRRYLKKEHIEVKDCLFVGDQIFTDRCYVKKLKGRLILTEPLSEKDNWVTKIPRFFDKRIRRRWLKKGLLGEECPGREKEVSECSSSVRNPVE